EVATSVGPKPSLNKVQSQTTTPLRQQVLQTALSHRECLLPPQRLPAHCHALRQARQKLPCSRLPRRRCGMVDFVSPDPSLDGLQAAIVNVTQFRKAQFRGLRTAEAHVNLS